VRTAKPATVGRMRLVQSSRVSSLHLSFLFELSRQAVAIDTFSSEEYADIYCIYVYCDGNA
jgi:hypothetical protein